MSSLQEHGYQKKHECKRNDTILIIQTLPVVQRKLGCIESLSFFVDGSGAGPVLGSPGSAYLPSTVDHSRETKPSDTRRERRRSALPGATGRLQGQLP
jgi:hypothetical protein